MWSESKMSDKVFLEKVYLYHRKKKKLRMAQIPRNIYIFQKSLLPQE